MLIGIALGMPMILAYTGWAFWVFRAVSPVSVATPMISGPGP